MVRVGLFGTEFQGDLFVYPNGCVLAGVKNIFNWGTIRKVDKKKSKKENYESSYGVWPGGRVTVYYTGNISCPFGKYREKLMDRN